nr:DUF885 domain-containing protein [Salsipaludibacter albus]
MTATGFGMTGRDHRWDDFSPAGHDAWVRLWSTTRDELVDHLDDPDPHQSHAARVLVASLDEHLAEHAAGDHLRDLNHIHCPFTRIRDIFDIMDHTTPEGWRAITTRLATIGQPLAGYRATLQRGRDVELVPARRQVASIIEQARTLAGPDSNWHGWVDLARDAGVGDDQLTTLAAAVVSATGEVAAFADWLEHELLPVAPTEDGVGPERYARAVDRYIGDDLDLVETYEWGWQELGDLWDEMAVVAAEIDPDADVSTVIERLETDPDRAAPTPQAFVDFVQARLDEAVTQLDGVHFDLPDKMKTVTVNLAPPGGALGAWYINPSEDFVRPGSVWYSIGDKQAVPLWQEVSTAYHEGFPGHHLQVATVMDRADLLSRAHRMLVWYPGYGEGWALYAERLMDELGYFERPAWRLGMLASHAFRAARVVVDIGCHLDLAIPDHARLHAGERWDFDIAVDYMHRAGLQPLDVATSEVKRYLGWPGQAISYKVGERALLAIRDRLRERDGDDFDLGAFHRAVLDGGALRIDHLRERLLG